jgi:hypothetical protein
MFALVVNRQYTIPSIHGKQQRTVENNQRKDGKIVLVASQESGQSTCKVKKTWIWVFDKESQRNDTNGIPKRLAEPEVY